MGCPVESLVEGNYRAYGNRHGAEAALAKSVRFQFREDKELVEMALDYIGQRNPMTSYGFRLWGEDATHFQQLVYGEKGKPSRVRTEDYEFKEYNKRRKRNTRDRIRAVVTENLEIWRSHEDAEVYFLPEEVAEAADVHKNTAIRHMREMSITEEITDPAASGRGTANRVAFEYVPENEFDDTGDDKELVTDGGQVVEEKGTPAYGSWGYRRAQQKARNETEAEIMDALSLLLVEQEAAGIGEIQAEMEKEVSKEWVRQVLEEKAEDWGLERIDHPDPDDARGKPQAYIPEGELEEEPTDREYPEPMDAESSTTGCDSSSDQEKMAWQKVTDADPEDGTVTLVNADGESYKAEILTPERIAEILEEDGLFLKMNFYNHFASVEGYKRESDVDWEWETNGEDG